MPKKFYLSVLGLVLFAGTASLAAAAADTAPPKVEFDNDGNVTFTVPVCIAEALYLNSADNADTKDATTEGAPKDGKAAPRWRVTPEGDLYAKTITAPAYHHNGGCAEGSVSFRRVFAGAYLY